MRIVHSEVPLRQLTGGSIMRLRLSSIAHVIFLGAIITLKMNLAFADDKKIEKAEIQSFLKGYQSLVTQYPDAAKVLTIIDAKTRSQLPHCPGEMASCTHFVWPHCDSWGCCPIMK